MRLSKTKWILAITLATAVIVAQTPAGRGRGRQLPDGPGRDVTQKVCGATCHGPEMLTGAGRTREQWTGVVNAMVSRGAKATDTELVQIADYLAKNVGPGMVAATGGGRGGPGGPAAGPARGPGPLGGGAADTHVVDPAGADRGKTLYIAECITCHGNKARGASNNVAENQKGPDLVRSLTVLHDRYGNTLGPFLAKGHPLQSGRPSAGLQPAQVADIAHFLHQRMMETLRGGGLVETVNVLTGDPKAGAAYFNGAGRCSGCHSPTGDMKGIGKKYDPPTLQSKFLFPRTVGFGRPGSAAPAKSAPVTVKVTLPTGEVVSGTLDKLDDFNVSLRDAQGEYRTFERTAAVKVEKNDPYAQHVALLDEYTDKNMHDIVAYLESLK